MTLPASGALSFSQIQTEFGGSNPVSLSEYLGAASGIPGSGPISLSQFWGKSSIIYPGVGYTASSNTPGVTALATISFKTDGSVTRTQGGSTTSATDWVTPLDAGRGAAHEIYFHSTADPPFSSPPLDTWISLNTTRDITARAAGIGGFSHVTVEYYIRRVSDSVQVASGQIDCEAAR